MEPSDDETSEEEEEEEKVKDHHKLPEVCVDIQQDVLMCGYTVFIRLLVLVSEECLLF